MTQDETQFAGGHTATGAAWRIRYAVRGSGPGATGVSNYGRNLDALARRFRCWVIDFPGWGQSSKNL